MSIRVICPNGHHLHAKESLAGRVVMCPLCDQRIRIPKHPHEISEDEALAMIGPPEKKPRGAVPPMKTIIQEESAAETETHVGTATVTMPLGRRRECPHCELDIPEGYHVCPNCRAYIAKLADL